MPIAVDGEVLIFDPKLTTEDTAGIHVEGHYGDGTLASYKLTEKGTSEDPVRGSQIRVGTEDLSEDNYLEAGSKDNPVYWTVSFEKTYTLYVGIKDGVKTISYEEFEGGTPYEVPFSFSTTIDYWDSNNACPGGPWYIDEETGNLTYDEEMEIPWNFSGIDIDLNNHYGTLTIQKNIVGYELTEDMTFTFNVYYVNSEGEKTIYSENVTMKVKAGRSMGHVTLVQVPYGTYCVEEVTSGAMIDGYSVGVQYGSGNIEVSEEKSAGLATVTNTYAPQYASVELTGTKALTGRTLKDGEFAFTVTENVEGVPTTVATGTNDADGKIAFSKIEYNAPGTHTYTVREDNGGLGGVTYDTAGKTVKVNVTADAFGVLSAAVDASSDTIAFSNSYAPSGNASITLTGTKTLTGRTMQADEFSFRVMEGETQVATGTNAANGTITFTPISYTAAGTHTYKINEVKDSLGGVTYDTTVKTVKVNVTDNGAGQFVAAVDASSDTIAFSNSYAPQGTSITLTGTKTLTGRTMTANEFSFRVMEGETQVATGTNAANGTITFTPISYTAAGTHTYKINEVKGSLGGVTYDTAVKTVKVNVTDNGAGQLVAALDASSDTIAFANSYAAKGTTITLTGTKTLTGRAMEANEFSFRVMEGGTQVAAGTNAANGVITFTPISYAAAGSHTYTISEVRGSRGGVTYDTAVRTVKVNVTDNGTGRLTAVVTPDSDKIAFTNVYTLHPKDVVISLEKLLKGDTPETAAMFTFILSAETPDAPMPEKTSITTLGAAKADFGTVTFTEAGTYVYKVREEKGTIDGYTYDDEVYTVTYTVTEQDGELPVVCTITDADGKEADAVAFTNVYQKPAAPPKTGDAFMKVLVLVSLSIACVILGMIFRRKSA